MEPVRVKTLREVKPILQELQGPWKRVKGLRIYADIIPAKGTKTSIPVSIVYKHPDTVRVVAISTTGFPLFRINITNSTFSAYMAGKGKYSGSKGDLIRIPLRQGFYFLIDPLVIKELLPFYGLNEKDRFILVEETKGYYLLTQFVSHQEILFPARKWWVQKGGVYITRKEIFPSSYAILYSNPQRAGSLWMPMEITVQKEGKTLFKLKIESLHRDN